MITFSLELGRCSLFKLSFLNEKTHEIFFLGVGDAPVRVKRFAFESGRRSVFFETLVSAFDATAPDVHEECLDILLRCMVATFVLKRGASCCRIRQKHAH